MTWTIFISTFFHPRAISFSIETESRRTFNVAWGKLWGLWKMAAKCKRYNEVIETFSVQTLCHNHGQMCTMINERQMHVFTSLVSLFFCDGFLCCNLNLNVCYVLRRQEMTVFLGDEKTNRSGLECLWLTLCTQLIIFCFFSTCLLQRTWLQIVINNFSNDKKTFQRSEEHVFNKKGRNLCK